MDVLAREKGVRVLLGLGKPPQIWYEATKKGDKRRRGRLARAFVASSLFVFLQPGASSNHEWSDNMRSHGTHLRLQILVEPSGRRVVEREVGERRREKG